MTHFEISLPSPLGPLRLIADAMALCYVLLPGERPRRLALPERTRVLKTPVLEQAAAELEAYFQKSRTDFTVALRSEGTAFEKRVWESLRRIPYGETRTYGELAAELGSPQAARAVGRANSLNPLSVIVPCHRVVGKKGSLVGFAGGLAAKAYLIELERTASQRR